MAAIQVLTRCQGGLYTCSVLQPLLELLKANLLPSGISEQASSNVCGTS